MMIRDKTMRAQILLAPFRLLPRGSARQVIIALTIIILVMAVLSIFYLVDPITIDPIRRLSAPNLDILFGADQFGHDIFSRCVYGARVSLLVATLATLLACSLGGIVGLLAGYSKLFDLFGMRFMDVLMTVPTILLAITLSSLMGTGFTVVVVSIGIAEIPIVSRIVRSAVLAIAAQPYIEAARLCGRPSWQVLLFHVLPNVLPVILVHATFLFAHAIMLESTLSFLGAGIPPETPSWGNMIAIGKHVFVVAPWTIIFPGLCIAITVYAINTLGDHMRERLDPAVSKAFRASEGGAASEAP